SLHETSQRQPSCYRTGAFCTGTIAFPIGHSARPGSFRCAQANGMPTMVRASRIAVTRWPSANHHPARSSHTMLPITPNGPVPTSSRPKYSPRGTADNGDRHDDGGDHPAERHPQAAENDPEQVEKERDEGHRDAATDDDAAQRQRSWSNHSRNSRTF